jgi:hypothetical protein
MHSLAGDEGTREAVLEIHQLVKWMVPVVVQNQRRGLCVWDGSNCRTVVESKAFKDSLVREYARADGAGRLFCMVLNRSYPRDVVRASHLWKHCTGGRGLEAFGIDPGQLDHWRNGLLLARGLEMAFDRLEVCFRYNPFTQKLLLLVLDPGLQNKVVHPSKSLTFGQIDGWALQHPKENFPFRRILAFHARCAIDHARNRKWVKPDEFDDWQEYMNTS